MDSSSSSNEPPVFQAAAKYGADDHDLRPFVHLRVHSAYSLLEGALPLARIVDHLSLIHI